MRVLPLFIILLLLACNHGEKTVKNSVKPVDHLISDTISFTISKNHLISKIRINDTIDANFVFDTGSHTALAFDSAFALRKGLLKMDTTLKDKIKKRRAYNNAEFILESSPIKFTLGKTIDTSITSQVFDIHRIIGDKAQGIIGMAFLKKYLLEIDYVYKRIILHQHKTYKKTEILDTVKIYPSDKAGLQFYMDVKFNPGQGLPSFSEKCILDLGVGSNSILISKRLVSKHGLLHLKGLQPVVKNRKVMTNEEITGFTTTFASLELGKFKMNNPVVDLYTSKSGMTSFIMPLIGNYVFKGHNRIFIDFKNHEIYIPKIKN